MAAAASQGHDKTTACTVISPARKYTIPPPWRGSAARARPATVVWGGAHHTRQLALARGRGGPDNPPRVRRRCPGRSCGGPCEPHQRRSKRRKTVTIWHERSLLSILPGQSVRSHCHSHFRVVSSFQAMAPHGSGWTGDSSSHVVSGRSLHRRRMPEFPAEAQGASPQRTTTAGCTRPAGITHVILAAHRLGWTARLDQDGNRSGRREHGSAGLTAARMAREGRRAAVG
jgi:hypothetical protein